MKVLIIEDERRAANRLIKLIEAYDSSLEVIGRIDSVKNAIIWFRENQAPDLIFMDIQLADGLCFDIFEESSVLAPVIFTTAYDEYAIRAFNVNSIHYLLKPIAFKELKTAMDKFHLLKSNVAIQKSNVESTAVLLNKSYKTRFVVKLGDHIHTIRVEDIICFLSKEKASYLYTLEGRKYIIDYTLEQLEHLLSPQQFFRVNRKCIINLDSIGDIIYYSNSRWKIHLKNFDDAEEVLVSREKVQEFKNWLDR